MDRAEPFEVEVVHATPGRQRLVRVRVEPPCTVERAVRDSGILDEFPGLEFRPGQVGIFGEIVDPARLVAPEDRIELYRPLAVDPKESRRRRASASPRRRQR